MCRVAWRRTRTNCRPPEAAIGLSRLPCGHPWSVFAGRSERVPTQNSPEVLSMGPARMPEKVGRDLATDTRARDPGHGKGRLRHHRRRSRPGRVARGMEARQGRDTKGDNGRWNKSPLTLRREQEAARGELSPPKSPSKRKRPRDRNLEAVDSRAFFWCGWQESNPRLCSFRFAAK